MKEWPDDHPKAKLMARKRAAIISAAKDVFLRVGYEASSMEEIAALANVSIMTLYRHAISKEALFNAVILSACDYSEEKRGQYQQAIQEKPLQQVMQETGALFQEKITHPDTVAILRTVMVETRRFPQLASAAYEGFVHSWQLNLEALLPLHPEFAGKEPEQTRLAVSRFLDDLMGTDFINILLEISDANRPDRANRTRTAARNFMKMMGLSSPEDAC
ncbi:MULTISPECIES: TetR/AcrR family transcriptional regulator [Erwinia]|uniref:TetR family transcriptional regulator n=2 Tax=Erwinia TaxID=551 RepID=A0A014N3I1_9GAMM|nr:TetR/AcrR family transcriptional regulator [Erwinia mallotivora]EXU73963.1 TetR family transcriptional regulator [Erwinia mallotivora]